MSSLGDQFRMRVSPYAAQYIRNKAVDLMNGACRITKPGEVVYDKATRTSRVAEGALKYEGPCRLWEVPAGSQVVVGDEQITVSQTYFSIPHWVMPLPEADDIILITTSDDPDLAGRMIKIMSTVRGGGLRASRRFQVRVSDSKKDTW